MWFRLEILFFRCSAHASQFIQRCVSSSTQKTLGVECTCKAFQFFFHCIFQRALTAIILRVMTRAQRILYFWADFLMQPLSTARRFWCSGWKWGGRLGAWQATSKIILNFVLCNIRVFMSVWRKGSIHYTPKWPFWCWKSYLVARNYDENVPPGPNDG